MESKEEVNQILKEIKEETSYLRNKLINLVKTREMVEIEHGVRKGPQLSERMLVDTKIALIDKSIPTRAYLDKDLGMDTSMAASIVIDESSSMQGCLRDTKKIVLSLVEPLSLIGCKVQAHGFRWGTDDFSVRDVDHALYHSGVYHRYRAISHDLFKDFEDNFALTKWRFNYLKATGTTPMGDGIQFGLECLKKRRERHKLIFCITDGKPDFGQLPIVKWQLQQAAKYNITILGVGMGKHAEYVIDTFDDYVWAENFKELPKMIIKKLNEIIKNIKKV